MVMEAEHWLCLPHAGGDTPFLALAEPMHLQSAPRRWGYTGF